MFLILLIFLAQGALDTIFRKWEVVVALGYGMDTQRFKKPKASYTSERERVPAFLSPRTTAIDEDPTPFSVRWGLRNKEYKKSSAFNKLLDDEYDSNFPGTFSSYWKEIISEVGKKVSGVDLDIFPVPPLPGLEGSSKASDAQSSEFIAQSPSSSRVIEDTTLSPSKETPEIPLLTSGTDTEVPFKEKIDLW